MAPLAAVVYVAVSAATVASIAMAPVLVPVFVSTAGFGSSGIATGSWAAGLMSGYAGAVPAGSLCAVLQSVGMAGLSTTTVVVTETVAATLAAGSAAVGSYLFKDRTQNEAPPDIQNQEAKQVCAPTNHLQYLETTCPAGAVPAGSLRAVIPSVGMAGLSSTTIGVTESVAAALAAGRSAAVGSHLFKEGTQNEAPPNIENQEAKQVDLSRG